MPTTQSDMTRLKIGKLLSGSLLLSLFASLLAGCGAGPQAPVASEMPPTQMPATKTAATETPVGPIAALIAAAQDEGTLNTIGISHNWCNYGEMIEAFKSKYGLGINELDPKAGSGDQAQAVKDNQDNKNAQAPDVVDVEVEFGRWLKDQSLIQPYKVSTWNSIPEKAKDPNGYWYGGYYWVLSFLVNTDVQPQVPHDWADLLDPKYKGQVAFSGDPRISNQAMQSVLAAALANGGSLENAEPGLDFFAKLNKAGNLVPLISRDSLVAIGRTPIRITWDYNALLAVDAFTGHPKAEVVIPVAGRLGMFYIQAISAHAPHPNAAKLWMEFLYSDEGQLLWMKGHCHPIREGDLLARTVIPEDLRAKVPEVSGTVFPTLDQLNTAKNLIAKQWDPVVGVDIRPAP